MRTWWKWIAGTCPIVAAIQFIRPERSNPPVNTSQTIHASLPVDPSVGATLRSLCEMARSSPTFATITSCRAALAVC